MFIQWALYSGNVRRTKKQIDMLFLKDLLTYRLTYIALFVSNILTYITIQIQPREHNFLKCFAILYYIPIFLVTHSNKRCVVCHHLLDILSIVPKGYGEEPLTGVITDSIAFLDQKSVCHTKNIVTSFAPSCTTNPLYLEL